MHHKIRICLFNAVASSAEDLLEVFGRIPSAEVTANASQWEEVSELLAGDRVDAVAVNLDDDLEFGLNLVQRIVRAAPDLAIIGISADTSPKTIISAMRAGCAQFVTAPVDAPDLANALDRIRHTHVGVTTESRRICVVGSAGGVGCTTIACNLAMELAQVTGRRSGLVDLNLEFGDVACAFDCEPKYSIADVCIGSGSIDRTLIESAAHDLSCDVSVLARPEKVDSAREVTPEAVEQALEVMGSMYPNVVVDLPRSFSFLSAAAVKGADLVLIIMQLNVPGVRNATRIYDVLLSMGAPDEHVEIIINRCKADHERVTPEDVEKHFSRPVFATIPNDYRRVMSALDFGHPIFTNSPTSAARLAIHEIAKKIVADPKAGADQPRPRPGFIGRLLSRK